METNEGDTISTDQIYAVVQTSCNELTYQQLKQEFVSVFNKGQEEEHYCVVPIDSIIRPLLVYKDYGGNKTSYFSALPRRYWARYFGDEVEISSDDDMSI